MFQPSWRVQRPTLSSIEMSPEPKKSQAINSMSCMADCSTSPEVSVERFIRNNTSPKGTCHQRLSAPSELFNLVGVCEERIHQQIKSNRRFSKHPYLAVTKLRTKSGTPSLWILLQSGASVSNLQALESGEEAADQLESLHRIWSGHGQEDLELLPEPLKDLAVEKPGWCPSWKFRGGFPKISSISAKADQSKRELKKCAKHTASCSERSVNSLDV